MSDKLEIRDQRQPGWFFVDNEVIDRHGRQLGAYGIAVYSVLSRYAKNGTQQVDLSGRDIAAAIGISQDRVRKSLADLVDLGLICHIIPERTAPGLISTITLLNVKQILNVTRSVEHGTERHMFGSLKEPNASRSAYKEEKKQNRERNTTLPPYPPALTTPQNNAKSATWVRPTLEDVTAYCHERGDLVNPERWFNYYSANGWKIGRNAMRDWKAAVRTWERNGVNST